ncbi:MAG: Lytic transglycosylase, catalytic [Pseudomonas sp.]|nr:Lytic transglycosylase, catalytic [Pseudomonas sp.]
MDVRLPDGTVIQGVPDGMSRADLVAKLKANGHDVAGLDSPAGDAPGKVASIGAGLGKGVGDVALGLQNLVGMGLSKLGGIGKEKGLKDLIVPQQPNALERAGQWLQDDAQAGKAKTAAELAPYKQANPISAGAGELGGQILGTMPVGGAIAAPIKAAARYAPALAPLAEAVGTSGMRAGGATGLVNPLVRAAGGAATGGATAALVNPGSVGTGAAVGAVMPGTLQLAGKAGALLGQGASDLAESASKRLMQSAIKPTIKQLRTGDADAAVQALLDYGINPTKAGVNKLRELIDAKNAEIASAIGSSTAQVDKQNVLGALAGVQQKFGNQVSPTADLSAIQRVADDFSAHPNLPGASIPVQAAQDLKQGTYRVLAGKYGQMGSAETEAQKSLARGLKDEIAAAVPAVGPLNAEESRLLTTLSVAERRALMEMNKNPVGLASLASNPLSWAAFMADKSALFKSLAARAVNASANAPNALQSAIGNQAVQQLGYRAAPVLAADR